MGVVLKLRAPERDLYFSFFSFNFIIVHAAAVAYRQSIARVFPLDAIIKKILVSLHIIRIEKSSDMKKRLNPYIYIYLRPKIVIDVSLVRF